MSSIETEKMPQATSFPKKKSTNSDIKMAFVIMDFEISGWRAACWVIGVETKKRKGNRNGPYLFILLPEYYSVTPTPACGEGQDQKLEHRSNLSNSSGVQFARFTLILGNLFKT